MASESYGRGSVRILWSSNAIWATTGYGIQAQYLLPRLKALGHEVAQFAWYGLQGARLKLNDLIMYPAVSDIWGNDIIGAHVADFKADLVISLQDIWVLPPNYAELVGVPWMPWFPVDQAPAPPVIVERAKTARYPTTYSHFGQEAMRGAGLECAYIPHGVDCDLFKPRERGQCRKRLKLPDEAFIVAMVGANQGSPARKGFPEAFKAFKVFHDEHPEALLYMHTLTKQQRGGIDLERLMASIDGFPKQAVRFVSQYHYVVGMPAEYLVDLYNAADVLLQCSYNEGFGLPLIEAQACGCPVLATNNTSMPELVFSGALIDVVQDFYSPLDLGGWVGIPSIPSIVEKLEWAYDMLHGEKAREWLTAKARQGALAYDWGKVVAEYWKPFLERVEADMASGAGHVHRWAPTGFWDSGYVHYPCLDPKCQAAQRVAADGKQRDVVPAGWGMIAGGIPLDIRDNVKGGVAKGICHEVARDYGLDAVPIVAGDACIDVGAQVGIVSIYLAKRSAGVRVYAVEPAEENLDNLRRNVEANHVADCVTIIPAAMTGDGRDVELHGNAETNSGGYTIYAKRTGAQCHSITLAALIAESGAERIKVLKLDCEGAEYEILRADPELLRRVDYVVGEFHYHESNPQPARDLLEWCAKYIPADHIHVTLCPVDFDPVPSAILEVACQAA